MQESEFLKAAEASHDLFSNHHGLDYLRAVIASQKTYPFGKLLNMHLVAAGDGWSELQAEPSYAFYNPMMRAHGGWLAAIMDSTMGSAVISKLKDGMGAGTVQLSVNYVHKVAKDSGRLIGKGRVIHAGRSMLTAEAQLFDAAGRLCVHSTGTFLVYNK